MKGDGDEGRLWSPLEAWMKVWRFWSEKGEREGESEKKEYLISERKNGADSSILMVNISFSFYHAMGATATEKKHIIFHLSTFLLSFVRTRSNTDSRDFFLDTLIYKPNYYA